MISSTMTREMLVSELGIAELKPELQNEILSGVGENIVRAVMIAVIEKLPPQAQEQFKKLTEAGDAEGVAALLKANIENPDVFIEQEARKEIAAFKDTLAKQLEQ